MHNDASNMFQEFARQEEIDNIRQDVSQELLNLIHNDKLVAQFIDLLYLLICYIILRTILAWRNKLKIYVASISKIRAMSTHLSTWKLKDITFDMLFLTLDPK